MYVCRYKHPEDIEWSSDWKASGRAGVEIERHGYCTRCEVDIVEQYQSPEWVGYDDGTPRRLDGKELKRK